MTRARIAAAAGVLAACLAGNAARADLPGAVREAGYELRQVGKGRLTWLGFGIYEASLWTSDGRFEGFGGRDPLALALWYERRFSRAELIDITLREWQRLDLGAPAQRQAWAASLGAIWVDVRRGDNMTAVVVPGQETRFYDRDALLGRIPDPAFGPAFLRIWLDPRTAIDDLRVELLGGSGAAAQ